MSRTFWALVVVGCGAAAGGRPASRAEPADVEAAATASTSTSTDERDAREGREAAGSLCPGTARALVSGARHPRVALGRSGAVLTSSRGDDPSIQAHFVPTPLDGAAVSEVASSGALEPGRTRLTEPALGRLDDEAAVVWCVNDDFCADRISTPSERCSAFECALRVPAHAATVTFALPHQSLGVGESFLFDGDVLFAAVAAYRGGGMSNVLGFVVTETEARRVLLHSFGEDEGQGDQLWSFIEPGADGGAVVTLEVGELAREHRIGMSRDGRRTAPDEDRPDPAETVTAPEPDSAPAPAPRVVERRPSPDDPPFLATYRGESAVPIEALASDGGRFAPTVVPFGDAFLLVFSEGLRSETRIRAMRIDAAAQPLDEGVSISSPGVEAGRAHVDVLDGVAYVVWEERAETGWTVLGVTLSACSESL